MVYKIHWIWFQNQVPWNCKVINIYCNWRARRDGKTTEKNTTLYCHLFRGRLFRLTHICSKIFKAFLTLIACITYPQWSLDWFMNPLKFCSEEMANLFRDYLPWSFATLTLLSCSAWNQKLGVQIINYGCQRFRGLLLPSSNWAKQPGRPHNLFGKHCRRIFSCKYRMSTASRTA